MMTLDPSIGWITAPGSLQRRLRNCLVAADECVETHTAIMAHRDLLSTRRQWGREHHSLHLEPGRLDHRRPLLQLGGDQSQEILRRPAGRLKARLQHVCSQLF